jgi:hypothetical protein
VSFFKPVSLKLLRYAFPDLLSVSNDLILRLAITSDYVIHGSDVACSRFKIEMYTIYNSNNLIIILFEKSMIFLNASVVLIIIDKFKLRFEFQ